MRCCDCVQAKFLGAATMKNIERFVGLLLMLLSLRVASGADANALIKQLGSDKESERAAAIAELSKMGEAARDAMLKAELEKMDPQPLAIVRRLIGKLLVDKTDLKPIDPALLTPF